MPQTDVIVYKYSEDLVNIPRAHLALELKQDYNSVKLCPATE